MRKGNDLRDDEAKKVVVALYARESSKGQEDKELSTPAQLKEMKNYCYKKGWIIYDEFIDRAKTGTNDRRKGFQDLIYKGLKLDTPPFDKIIVWKLSRFARNKNDSRLYKARLRKRGVSVHSMTQEAANEDDVAGYIIESVYEAMDEQYSRELGEDVRRGHAQVAEEGYYPFGGMSPHGYKYEKIDFGKYTRQKLAINKDEVNVVKKIFEMSLNGFGSLFIVQELNKKGYRTRKGKKWAKAPILRILRNAKYTGTIEVGSKTYENFHPVIIKKEIFDKVQDKIRSRSPFVPDRKIRNSLYILSGLIECGHCGQKMNGYVCKGRHGKDYHYYSCQTYLKKGRSECSQKNIRQKDIESAVQILLEKHALTEKHLTKMVTIVNQLRKRTVEEDLSQRTAIVNNIRSLKVKIKTVDDTIMDKANKMDHKTLIYYTDKLGGHLRELETNQLRLEELDTIEYNPLPEDIARIVAEKFRELFKDSNLVMRKNFLHNFIEKIVVKDEEAKLIYKPPIQDEGLCLGGDFRGRRDSNPRLPA